jgi:hypothetical protein
MELAEDCVLVLTMLYFQILMPEGALIYKATLFVYYCVHCA